MGMPEFLSSIIPFAFAFAALFFVVAVVVAKRRRRTDTMDDHAAPTGGPADVSRTVGADRAVVFSGTNSTLAAVVAAALAGADLEPEVRSTGTAGYGPTEYSVLVPTGQRDRAREVLEELPAEDP
ncbi:MAG: hypothetical protein KY457_06380 [Actinobacteria bacterium]|nr:hypothetical protein [Actinomycetota bacterium]